MLQPSEASLQFPFEGPPAPGALTKVAEGVHWLRMPLPFKLDHINLWLLEDGDHWLIVDSGYPSDETRTLWQTILQGPAAERPPGRLLCTHFHPDHFGLSGWLTESYGLPLLMTQTEWLTGHYLRQLPREDYVAQQGAFFAKHGLPRERVESLARKGNAFRGRSEDFPAAYRRLRHGQELSVGGSNWRIIVGEGHAPEHASLYNADRKLLIAGDQILPKITPNISTPWFAPQSSPLGDYLASFTRFAELPGDALVLPSHRLPFYGLHARIDQIVEHHEQRLDILRQACQTPRAAAEILDDLFGRKLDDHHLTFAMGEAIAHLAYLEELGELRSQERDGVTRYGVSG